MGTFRKGCTDKKKQNSTIAIAFIFASSGDMMLEIRHSPLFAKMNQELFQYGALLFLVQHILMIFHFGSYFKKFRALSLIVVIFIFLSFCLVIVPKFSNDLKMTAVTYSFFLCTSLFLSTCTISPATDNGDAKIAAWHSRIIGYEWYNVYGAAIFVVSDTILILSEVGLVSEHFQNLLFPRWWRWDENLKENICDRCSLMNGYFFLLCRQNKNCLLIGFCLFSCFFGLCSFVTESFYFDCILEKKLSQKGFMLSQKQFVQKFVLFNTDHFNIDQTKASDKLRTVFTRNKYIKHLMKTMYSIKNWQ
ncbi:hypothetical protein RFI_14425 [Reticulomyxa filosa]|uniref:Uncharacterized protein n=1 Tax=Reticulomyxa filosa TaxID=46433 RepID=X6NBS4_RETFI|nr:hypothetical protein RFI_14425 [Reticulomyxa filosa]|eukprot:ETO22772.1 hypothetical protein RFI_14425 [Reticulomyxa filosa]